MGKIGDMIRKAMSSSSKYLDKDSEGRKITPNETELMYYKEKERLQNVKRELERYKKEDNLFQGLHNEGSNFLKPSGNLMKCKDNFKGDKKHNLLSQRRLF